MNLFGKPRLCMPRDMQASCLGQENDLTSALLEEGLLESQCPESDLIFVYGGLYDPSIEGY